MVDKRNKPLPFQLSRDIKNLSPPFFLRDLKRKKPLFQSNTFLLKPLQATVSNIAIGRFSFFQQTSLNKI